MEFLLLQNSAYPSCSLTFKQGLNDDQFERLKRNTSADIQGVDNACETLGSIDLGGDVVEKGRYKKTLIESNGLISILNEPDPTLQIGWNVEAYEDELELFVRGLLDVNVTSVC